MLSDLQMSRQSKCMCTIFSNREKICDIYLLFLATIDWISAYSVIFYKEKVKNSNNQKSVRPKKLNFLHQSKLAFNNDDIYSSDYSVMCNEKCKLESSTNASRFQISHGFAQSWVDHTRKKKKKKSSISFQFDLTHDNSHIILSSMNLNWLINLIVRRLSDARSVLFRISTTRRVWHISTTQFRANRKKKSSNSLLRLNEMNRLKIYETSK